MAINTFGNLTVVGSANVTGNVSVIGGIIANGEIGNAGQVLTSNSSSIYWSTVSGEINLDSTYTWTNTHTFTKAVNVTGTFQGAKTDIGNTLITGVANIAGNVYITGNVGIGIAPSNARQLYVYNGASTGTANDNTTLTVRSVNRFAVIEVDSNASRAGAYIFKTAGTETGRLHYDSTGNYLSFSVNGSVYTTAERMRIDAGGNVGIGNTTPNAKLAVTGTANISGNVSITANVSITGGIIANGSIGTTGQVLASNSSGIYWTTIGGTGTVTQVASGNGIGGGPITTTGTLYIVANTGIIANVTGLYVNSAYIATLDSNNSAYLGGNLPAYYTNASNITTGVLPWAQAPVGTVNTSDNFTLNGNITLSGTFANVTGTLQGTKTNIGNTVITGTANVTGNVLASGTFVNVTGNLQSATLRTGLSTITGNATLSGTFANVTGTFQSGKTDVGNTVITGTANVTGNLYSIGSISTDGNISSGNSSVNTQILFNALPAIQIHNGNTDNKIAMFHSGTAGIIYTQNTALTVHAIGLNPLNLQTNSVTRIRVSGNGNIGINNTTPDSTLSVTGTANVSGNTTLGAGLIANGSIGTSGQVLTSNSTGIFWSTPTTGTVTQVSSANGLAGGPITSTGSLYVLSNTGIISNSSGVFIDPTYISTINANNAYNLGGVNASGYALLSGATFTGNVSLGGTFANVTGTFQSGKTDVGNTLITGTANVTGNVLASGTFVNVTGNLQSSTLRTGLSTITGNATLSGAFTNVTSTFQSGKTDVGNTLITGTANVSGNVLASGTFVNVTGDLQSSTLRTGLSTITGNITASGTFVNITGTLQGTKTDIGNTVITGTANVTGNVLLSGTFVNVTGDLQSSTLRTGLSTITGNATLSGAFTNVTSTFQAGKTDIGNTVITGTANVTGNVLLSGTFVNVTGDLTLGTNAKKLSFATLNTSAGVYFTQQNDDNFVFYTTNTAYSPRAVWSIYANSITSYLNIVVPLQPSAGIIANGNIGTAGQVLASNGGGVYWSTPSALSVDQAATYTWTNTHTFTKAVNVTGTLQGTKTDIGNTVITGTANVTGNVLASGTFVNITGDLSLGTNNKKLSFATVNTSAGAYFIQQNDDNFVFYTTNTAYSPRAIWSIFANSITSNLNIIVALNAQGNSTLGGNFTNVTGTLQGTKTDIGNTVITGTANVTGNVLVSGTFVNVTGDLQSATLRTGLSTITGNATLSGAFVNVTSTFQGTKTDIGNTVITGTANVTGNVLLSGTFANVTGTLQSVSFRTGTATIGNTLITGPGNIEIATNATGDRNALVDFHSDDTYTDYSFRMLAGAGNNGIRQIVARGTFGLYLDTTDAAPIVLRTTGVEAARVDAGGNVGIGNTTPNAKLQVTGTANISGNVVLGGNLNISTGVVTGNGFGLTSVNYLSQSTSAVGVQIFGNTSAGGDINTWKDGTRFYPTLPSNINTLDMNIYTEIFIMQVADAVPTANLSGAGGPGNPELSYRVIKVPSAGANTTLLTADWQTISVPGSASFFLNSIRDTTPTSGNTVGYLLQYQWRTIASNPDANAGTISVASTTTLNATGTGTYFTSKLNTRLGISPGALAFRNINTIYGNRLLGVDTAFGTAQTAVTYRVRDPYANVSMMQTNVAFNFVGYK